MLEVDTALYTRLNADVSGTAAGTFGALGITAVYRQLAPQGAAEPYVIFGQQAGTDAYTFNDRERRSLVYQVKAVAQSYSGSVAAAASNRIDALLFDQPLTVSGWTCKYLRRETEVEYIETSDGQPHQHVGGLYRIEVEPS